MVGVATLAAAAVWFASKGLLDRDLLVPDGPDGGTMEVGLFPVLLFALVSALAGWGLLALLERRVRHPRRAWPLVSVAVLVLSFVPLVDPGIDGGTTAALALMHVAVAAVLLPGLLGRARSAPGSSAESLPRTAPRSGVGPHPPVRGASTSE